MKYSLVICKIIVYSGIQIMLRAETKHPLDPLSAAEISIAVATVRAAGATPEVHSSFLLFFSCPIVLICHLKCQFPPFPVER